MRRREEAATRDILNRADVVLVTLTSASPDSPLKLLDDDHFELVVIDECSQVTKCSCFGVDGVGGGGWGVDGHVHVVIITGTCVLSFFIYLFIFFLLYSSGF